MGKLLDADTFDERIRLDVGLCEEELTEDFKDGISTILEMMKTAPTVDAVPVVRCKDCKSFSHGYCRFHDAKFVRPDGYCYWGERKDGNGNG